jgi:hypothetical protein
MTKRIKENMSSQKKNKSHLGRDPTPKMPQVFNMKPKRGPESDTISLISVNKFVSVSF